ncbi:hypothetical protein Scep_023325 [Stephania cephalantha]|uniref:Uncharacterized protein n=1 Tax=Stephania cephalantha TaxID=152367 RepID=A0AAP0EUI7_9MAGN
MAHMRRSWQRSMNSEAPVEASTVDPLIRRESVDEEGQKSRIGCGGIGTGRWLSTVLHRYGVAIGGQQEEGPMVGEIEVAPDEV